MKTLILTMIAGGIALGAAYAGKDAETTVTGDVLCAHCDLEIKTSCQKALQTTDEKVFLLEGKVAKKFFEKNEKAKKVTATGTTSKDGDHTVLEAKKIEVADG